MIDGHVSPQLNGFEARYRDRASGLVYGLVT
jgi:hypothetical protein